MTTIKIFARQVPPEYQESHIEIDTDYINLVGNRDYNKHTSLLFDYVFEALHEGVILDEWEGINDNGNSLYYTWGEALRDIIPPSGRGEYTRAERLKIPQIAKEYYTSRSGNNENDKICELLGIVTGQEWSWRTIRGCCQSEWTEAFYPVNAWPGDTLKRFEAEYFNTGSEWIIHYGEEEPETADDIEGYSTYCATYNPRDEIAEEHGVKPEEVQLYSFDGWERSANWRAV